MFRESYVKYRLVGRYVLFTVPNCPATINIVTTKDVETKDIDVLA
jgi:hypothetical protein